jgi:hypothetical protein
MEAKFRQQHVQINAEIMKACNEMDLSPFGLQAFITANYPSFHVSAQAATYKMIIDLLKDRTDLTPDWENHMRIYYGVRSAS